MKLHSTVPWRRVVALFALVVLVAAGSVACNSGTTPEAQTAVGAASKGAAAGTEAAAQQLAAERDKAVADARQQLERVQGQLTEARARAEQAGPEVQQQAQQALAGVESQLGAARRAMDSAGQATAENWQQVSADLTKSLEQVASAASSAESQVATLAQQQREKAIAEIKPLLDKGWVMGTDGVQYLAYKRSLVERVQEKLHALGLYAGPADGYLEPSTQRALAKFQEQNETWQSGIPTPKTRELLFGEG